MQNSQFFCSASDANFVRLLMNVKINSDGIIFRSFTFMTRTSDVRIMMSSKCVLILRIRRIKSTVKNRLNQAEKSRLIGNDSIALPGLQLI